MQFFIQVHTCYSAHPIPARSPAEREGQTRKMGRAEGGRDDGEEEEGWGYGWVERGIHR